MQQATRRAVDLGALRSLEPVSRGFGGARGRPVDRHYIEGFLARHAADIRGRVLEFGDATYTRRFGGARVERSDVLYAAPGNPDATLVGDLARAGTLPAGEFDCVVCTQVLQYLYDVAAAVRTLAAVLRDGGVVLATMPGITQVSPFDMQAWGEYWRFTSRSVDRLFGEAFDGGDVEVETYGNVLAATAFLQGLAVEDLTAAELDHRDAEYEMLIAVRAVKRGKSTARDQSLPV